MDENRKKALARRSVRSRSSSARDRSCAWAMRRPSNMEVISTGSLGLDIALGVGGVPQGTCVEIYGPESSGKTTLTLHVVAEAQKLGVPAAFVDAEHALDPVYAEKLGVNDRRAAGLATGYRRAGLEITDMLVRSGAVDVVVVDSVAA